MYKRYIPLTVVRPHACQDTCSLLAFFFFIHGSLYRLPDTLAAQTQEGPREHGIKNNQLRERLSEEMFYRWHWIFTAGYL